MIASLVRSLGRVTVHGQALGDRSRPPGPRPPPPPRVFKSSPVDSHAWGARVLARHCDYNSNSAVDQPRLQPRPRASRRMATWRARRGTRLNTDLLERGQGDPDRQEVSEMLLGGPLAATARTAVITAVNAIAPVGDAHGPTKDWTAPACPPTSSPPPHDPALTMAPTAAHSLQVRARHRLGNGRRLRAIGIESAQAQTATDYKALVCLFKFGGPTATTDRRPTTLSTSWSGRPPLRSR